MATPVVEALRDDPLHVRCGHLRAALIGHQRLDHTVDDNVTTQAIHFQPGADVTDQQLQQKKTEPQEVRSANVEPLFR